MRDLKSLLRVTGLTAGLALTAFTSQALADGAEETALVAKGAYLARAGDCVACHTAPGGAPFAGGLGLETSAGKIYSTNITPDKDHGIGAYTEAQFAAAVREGIRADGTHLYPAMPYTAFAKVTDADIHALYTYFMTGVAPSPATVPATSLDFPYGWRWTLSAWNLFFTADKSLGIDPSASPEVKRGAYLVEGLGHCGACHSPRGFAMEETAYDASSRDFLAGGDLNGWSVPSLRGHTVATKGFATWTVGEIVDYLGAGRNAHAAVGGEMTSVVEHSLAYLKDDDLAAIAAYLKSIALDGEKTAPADAGDQAKATAAKLAAAVNLTPGERLYLDNCGACHFVTGQGAPRIFPALDGASVVNAPSPSGLISVILGGAATPSTDRSPSILPMPAFAKRLSDQDVATLATFLRSAWSNKGPAVTPDEVAAVRAIVVKPAPQPVAAIQ